MGDSFNSSAEVSQQKQLLRAPSAPEFSNFARPPNRRSENEIPFSICLSYYRADKQEMQERREMEPNCDGELFPRSKFN